MAPKKANDKKGGKPKEMTEEEMRRLGMSEDQIRDIMARRGLSAEDKKKEQEDEEKKRQERDHAAKEAKRQAEAEDHEAQERAKAEALKRYAEEEEAKRQAAIDEIERAKAERRRVMEDRQHAFDAAKKKQEEEKARLEEQWKNLSAEERERLEADRAAKAAAEDQKHFDILAAMKEQEILEQETAEAKAAREATLAARKEKVRAERERLLALGIVPDNDGEDGLLDGAFERDENFSSAALQAKAMRQVDKTAASLAGKQELKAFKNRSN